MHDRSLRTRDLACGGLPLMAADRAQRRGKLRSCVVVRAYKDAVNVCFLMVLARGAVHIG
jgi:hypothetical protein